jgi:hypothetical protein
MSSDVTLSERRTWRAIAQELASESDSKRVLELSTELSRAIDARDDAGKHLQSPHPWDLDGESGAIELHRITDNPYRRLQNSVQISDLLRSAMNVTCADFGNIQLFDSSQRVLRIVAQDGFEREFLGYFEIVRCNDDCACGAAVSKRLRVVVSNVATDPVFGESDSRNVLLRANVHAVQSTPLISTSGRLIGVLSTHYNRVQAPSALVWKQIDELAATFIGRVEVPETT